MLISSIASWYDISWRGRCILVGFPFTGFRNVTKPMFIFAIVRRSSASVVSRNNENSSSLYKQNSYVRLYWHLVNFVICWIFASFCVWSINLFTFITRRGFVNLSWSWILFNMIWFQYHLIWWVCSFVHSFFRYRLLSFNNMRLGIHYVSLDIYVLYNCYSDFG